MNLNRQPEHAADALQAEEYQLDEVKKIWLTRKPVFQHEEEYSSEGFDILSRMQERHFWYLGRHRFLLAAVRSVLKEASGQSGLSAVDLGGGCGGWIKYLKENAPFLFSELALADSSLKALEYSVPFVTADVSRYQVDLRDLGFRDRWHAAFLLDVIEHIPEEQRVLSEIFSALRPGGLLFITAPALRFFWSYNDDLAKHLRRYSVRDFRELAVKTGFNFLFGRYFMFFLSPLLLLSRWLSGDAARLDAAGKKQLMARAHAIPPAAVNSALQLIFSLEAPLGLKIRFPWGTSVLAVLQKPLAGA